MRAVAPNRNNHPLRRGLAHAAGSRNAERERSFAHAPWPAHGRRAVFRILPLAPDFVIELASPTDAPEKLAEKMAEYRACGVRLGWLLLPDGPQVHVYRPTSPPVVIDAPEHMDGGDVLPGFRLDLRPIWASAL
ncbi:MAG: Uma2 family endonuclease [Thiohalocapsa sp.]|uniref:Uma2 family endonuclease n=1 Tax=Thiohalocapsa sp. TaxID=2497641 RepID=UPI0025FCDD74|nr:Uma2 family endonuclease [Thiohalocapsa sp.]MCG6940158.1 Uma2 family endonuclease [Thiohalocapsa sp.]